MGSNIFGDSLEQSYYVHWLCTIGKVNQLRDCLKNKVTGRNASFILRTATLVSCCPRSLTIDRN